ncbi:hypothetical protein GCM10027082_23940 [Comamonas humi]
MKRDDIIRWANEAGLPPGYDDALESFAALVAADEREACARFVVETREWRGKGWFSTLCHDTKEAIATAIRARSKT